ncbi:MAG: ComEA family DNA-binding protein [Nitriliruptoraceae bacterium]
MSDHRASLTSGGSRAQRALRRVGDWIAASPAEVVGLGILLLVASVITGVAVITAAGRPDVPIGASVTDRRPPVAAEQLPAVTVHVAGAVAEPGLVSLAVDARVGDAIHAAGGPASDADLGQVNLARPLSDGEQVWVPRFGADADGSAVGGDGRINVNRASATELETLPGIGPTRAQQIIDHRTEHGPFVVPGDLRAVSGIGDATFQQLAELVTVG